MSRYFFVPYLIVALLFGGGCGRHPRDKGIDSQLEALASEIEQSRVKSLLIYYVPYEAETFSRLDPEMLKRYSVHRCELKLTSSLRTSLIKTLMEMNASPDGTLPPDLRWGVLFLDANHKIVFSIYLNGRYITGTGQRGLIQGKIVSFDGKFVSWLEPNYSAWCAHMPEVQ